MNAWNFRALGALAIAVVFLWSASIWAGGGAKEASAWQDMNAEVEAWLEGLSDFEVSAAAASPVTAEPNNAATAAAAAPEPKEDPPASIEQPEDAKKPAIDLNSASLEELDSLPGIGLAKAQAIISYREANGPFTRIDDVMLVKGVGPAIFEKMRSFIVVSSDGESGK